MNSYLFHALKRIDEKLETLQVPKTSKNNDSDYNKLHSQNVFKNT